MDENSCFKYVMGTSLQQYYSLLEESVQVIDRHSDLIKIYARKITEDLMKKIYLNKYGEEVYINGRFIDYYAACEKHMPSYISRNFNDLRMAGNSAAHFTNKNDVINDDRLVLEKLHSIFIWYMTNITKEISANSNIKFEIPKSIVDEGKELENLHKLLSDKKLEIVSLEDKAIKYKKIQEDILKYIDADNSEDYSIIENIDLIRTERDNISKKYESIVYELKETKKKNKDLEKREKELVKKIDDHKNEIYMIEKNYREKLYYTEQLQKEIIETNKKIADKDNKLKQYTIEKEELNSIINKLNIKKKNLEEKIEESLKSVDEEVIKKSIQFKKELDKNILELQQYEEKYNEQMLKYNNLDAENESIRNILKEKTELLSKYESRNNNLLQEIKILTENSEKLKVDYRNVKEEKKSEILLKDNLIEELRTTISNIEIENSKELEKLSRELILARENKDTLEIEYNKLHKKIEKHELRLKELESKTKEEIKKVNNLQNEKNELYKRFIEKESQLIHSEKMNIKLLEEVKLLRNKDINLEKQLKEVKEQYDELKNQYEGIGQDTKNLSVVIDELKYVADAKMQIRLSNEKEFIKEQLKTSENKFNDSIVVYNNKVQGVENRAQLVKEFLDDTGFQDMNNAQFFKAFLCVSGYDLKILYVIVTKLNFTNMVMNSTKKLFSLSNKNSLDSFIQEEVDKLSSVNEEKIRLDLYYELVKICEINLQSGFNRESFKKGLNEILDVGYSKLFGYEKISCKNKLDEICNYYILKIVMDLKENNNIDKRALIGSLKQEFLRLENKDKEKLFLNINLNIEEINDEKIICFIEEQPIKFLQIMIESVNHNSYMSTFNMLYSISSLFEESILGEGYGNTVSQLGLFSKSLYTLFVLISKNVFNKENIRKQAVPIMIMQCVLSSSVINNISKLDINFNLMDKLWNEERIKFKKINIDLKLRENEKNNANEEAIKIKDTLEKCRAARNTLVRDIASLENKFARSVISSEKKINLCSFDKYLSLSKRKKLLEEENNLIVKNDGYMKSLINAKYIKNNAEIISLNKNIKATEISLIQEAKNSRYFIEEYNDIKELDDKLIKIEKVIAVNEKNYINKNNYLKLKSKEIEKIRDIISDMKSKYPDM